MTTTTETPKFDVIYKTYYGKVLNFVFNKVNCNRMVAEDITAETFVKVSQHLNVFDPTKSQLNTWIYSIANRKVVDYYRSQSIRIQAHTIDEVVENQVVASGSATDSNYDRKLLSESIKRAMGSLKNNVRIVAELFFIEEKTHSEIVDLTGMSLSNVKVSISRARERLQEELRGEMALCY